MPEKKEQPHVVEEPKLKDNDISMATKYRANYTIDRNKWLYKVVNMRPASMLGSGIVLFEQKKYIEAIDHMCENILAKNMAPDYYHIALGYLCLCFGRMNLTGSAKLAIDEMQKIKLPPEYQGYAKKVEGKLLKEIENAVEEMKKIDEEKNKIYAKKQKFKKAAFHDDTEDNEPQEENT